MAKRKTSRKKSDSGKQGGSSSLMPVIIMVAVIGVLAFLVIRQQGFPNLWNGEERKDTISMPCPKPDVDKPVAAPSATEAERPITYRHHRNGRYGFGLYCPTFLQADAASENGDGFSFSQKGGASLKAWGSYNVTGETLKELFEQARKAATYSRMKENWFVVSQPRADGTISYTKTVYRADDDVFLTAQLIYPAKEKEKYEPVIEKVFGSFPK